MKRGKKQTMAFEPMVHLYGEINDSNIGKVIEKITTLAKREKRTIWLGINSRGGDEDQIFALQDTLRVKQIGINTIVMGIAYSAACIILQLGDRRVATEKSLIMFHDGSIETEDRAKLKRKQQFYDRMHEWCLKILSDRTRKPLKQIRDLSAQEAYFDAPKAKRFGLVDEIV